LTDPGTSPAVLSSLPQHLFYLVRSALSGSFPLGKKVSTLAESRFSLPAAEALYKHSFFSLAQSFRPRELFDKFFSFLKVSAPIAGVLRGFLFPITNSYLTADPSRPEATPGDFK